MIMTVCNDSEDFSSVPLLFLTEFWVRATVDIRVEWIPRYHIIIA